LTGARVLVAAAITMVVAPAQAQRREGRQSTSVLEVRLPVCVKFGKLAIPARSYRVTLGAGVFALADPQTMVVIATVPVTEAETAKAVEQPRIEIEHVGSRVDIVMLAGDRIYRATGVAAEGESPEPSPVVLAGKQERVVEGGGPEQRTATQLVARATKRYMSGIKHCVDKAHRSRWGTDDHRFVKCVCPIVLRWKMPPINAPLLMHWPLAKGRHGFSFHVTPAGKVTSCRVWAGSKPPAPKPDTEDAPEPAPEDAPKPAEAASKSAEPPETNP